MVAVTQTGGVPAPCGDPLGPCFLSCRLIVCVVRIAEKHRPPMPGHPHPHPHPAGKSHPGLWRLASGAAGAGAGEPPGKVSRIPPVLHGPR